MRVSLRLEKFTQIDKYRSGMCDLCVYFCTGDHVAVVRRWQESKYFSMNVMSKIFVWFRGYSFWIHLEHFCTSLTNFCTKKNPEHDKFISNTHSHSIVIKMSRPFTSNDKVCECVVFHDTDKKVFVCVNLLLLYK